MGSYLNTGFEKFKISQSSKIYIDKTELISVLNDNVETEQRFFCISRPRRFGKSVTANMLCAYYSKNTDSSFLFDNLKISQYGSYKTHLNQYNTIFINMHQFFSNAGLNVEKMLSDIESEIKNELKQAFPHIEISDERKLNLVLSDIYNKESPLNKKGFIFIIDEWDCIMREKQSDAEGIKIYLDYLRTLLKDQSYVALAYMTGILPIKKCGTHSSLNMFDEYSMTDPGEYASYIGFTENEVLILCEEYKVDFGLMKKWYDGYSFE
ncbi:AAA family ATPase, partial [Succinivibrio dextrinosolvens]